MTADAIDLEIALGEIRRFAELIHDKSETLWPAKFAQDLPGSLLIEYRNRDADMTCFLAGQVLRVLQELEAAA